MLKKLLPILAFCATLFASSQATETVSYRDNITIEGNQWEMVDLEFTVENHVENPVDIDFRAVFENKSHANLEIHGFYNGSNSYLIRFTPPSQGDWTFKTKSSLKELDSLKGTIVASSPKPGDKGRIRIDPNNPRGFAYENGDTYAPIAFEADWLFALDAENADGIPESAKLIDQLADNGFNQLVMNVFAYDVRWPKDEKLIAEHEYGAPSVFPFGGSNESPKHNELNIEFFQRLDRVIEYLDDQGIAAHLMIYVWNKLVNWPPADSDDDNRYYDYVVKRYQAYPNMVWDVSKEALGYGHDDMGYITRRIDRMNELDAYSNLITVHSYGYCKNFKEKVDFISAQIWSTELYHIMRDAYKTFPNHPILNIEHGGYVRSPYEVFPGSFDDPVMCLERAYKCVFAGTYPTLYWQGASWNAIITDIDSLPPEHNPRLDYYKHLATLYDQYDLANLSSGKALSNSGFCLTDEKNLFVYFVPKESISIGIRLPKELDGKMMKGTWFNPIDGSFSEPIMQENVSWPKYLNPNTEAFDILIIEVQ